jgi:hypothetical protein
VSVNNIKVEKLIDSTKFAFNDIIDHYTTLSIFRVSNESWTVDDFMRGDKETQDKVFAEWEVRLSNLFGAFNYAKICDCIR